MTATVGSGSGEPPSGVEHSAAEAWRNADVAMTKLKSVSDAFEEALTSLQRGAEWSAEVSNGWSLEGFATRMTKSDGWHFLSWTSIRGKSFTYCCAEWRGSLSEPRHQLVNLSSRDRCPDCTGSERSCGPSFGETQASPRRTGRAGRSSAWLRRDCPQLGRRTIMPTNARRHLGLSTPPLHAGATSVSGAWILDFQRASDSASYGSGLPLVLIPDPIDRWSDCRSR
jgi:hypothetical protein